MRDGVAAADPATGRTSNPKVWAIGDIVNGGAEVVNAVQAGKLAARLDRGRARPRRPADRARSARPTRPCPASTCSRTWPASAAPTRSGWPAARSRTPARWSPRAFDAGWGGAVWKTIGEPIRNVTARLGTFDYGGQRIVGINNIELISDRPTEVNIAEIREVKRRYPNHAVVISLMVESTREAWHEIIAKCNDTGADGYELNFGCPHGMSERGMGAAVGQVPEYVQMITEWVMEKAEIPVLVKLTPNVTDIRYPARAAQGGERRRRRADQHDQLADRGQPRHAGRPIPDVRGKGTHGGYAGPAVKPIALNMVSQVAADPEVGLPVSGIGGIETWRDAVDFLLVGATTVQVGTSVMHYGFRLIDDLVDGLSTYLRAKGLHSPSELVGKALPTITDWGHLDQEFRLLAQDRPGDVHPLQPVLHGVQRRRPPGDPLRGHQRDVAPGGRGRLLRGLPPVRVRLPGRRTASRSRSSRAPPPSTEGGAIRGARSARAPGSVRRGSGFSRVQPAASGFSRPRRRARGSSARHRLLQP